jgi:hypothetical protein
MKAIAVTVILFIFFLAFGIHLYFSLRKIKRLKKEKILLEEVNRIVAKEIFRSWLFSATGIATFGIWLIARIIETAPGIQNFWITFSGLSLFVGVVKLIGYYMIRKEP